MEIITGFNYYQININLTPKENKPGLSSCNFDVITEINDSSLNKLYNINSSMVVT